MNETLNLIFKAFAKGTLQKLHLVFYLGLFPSCFSVRLLKQIPNSKVQKPDISSSIIANSGERILLKESKATLLSWTVLPSQYLISSCG